MNKKGVISLVIIGIFILGLSAVLVNRLFFNINDDVKKIAVLEEIKNYGYVLEDRDSKLYKEEYYKLKNNLTGDSVDYLEYANSLTKLYVIDFYTLDNKLNKYDVGSLDFVLDSDKDNFKNKAMDTYYHNVKDNTYGNRKQNLPNVTEVNITDVEDIQYKLDDKSYDGYLMHVKFNYNINIDINTDLLITLVNKDNHLYVVKVENEE